MNEEEKKKIEAEILKDAQKTFIDYARQYWSNTNIKSIAFKLLDLAEKGYFDEPTESNKLPAKQK